MTALFLAIAVQFQGGVPPDSVEVIRKRARSAEARYERLARRLAPLRWGPEPGSDCDEIIGRFCITYDEGRLPDPEPEPGRVTDARREAIEALRLAFSFEPDRLETTGPLVRYLVEDDRPAEAVSAARTFAALSGDSVWSPLLLGFALHAAAEDTAAERLFEEGLRRMPAAEARRIRDAKWVLSRRDRGVYGDLAPADRSAADERVWRHSDPLYLTPGNERRAEHFARRIWSRILAMSPVVGGALRWGDDLEQITVRYGVPVARTRTRGTMTRDGSLIEHFDPDQLSFVQEDLLSRGPEPTPPPGETWSLEAPRSRSGFAARTVRRLTALDHQVTRFPADEGIVVRIDAQTVLDSAAAGRTALRTGLWLLDAETVDSVAAVHSTTGVVGDTARFGLELTVPPGAYVYSIEALEPETRLAARARYAIDLDPAPILVVSDPLLVRAWTPGVRPSSRADEVLEPHGRLHFEAGQTVGLYAEARGLRAAPDGVRHYRVELSVRDADRDAFPARALSWLGRRLGLSRESVPPRLAWSDRAIDEGPILIAVNFPLEDLDAGLHALTVAVTDLATGETTRSSRVFRIDGGLP